MGNVVLVIPAAPRAIVFVDGQNLFFSAKEAFGYIYPNYDSQCLSQAICKAQGWDLKGIQFYTGIPDASDNTFWHSFWKAKLAHMGRMGISVFSRPLRYRNQTVKLPDSTTYTFLIGQEKGVDIRIALDSVHMAHENFYDVCLIFSQDQDLTEAVEEIKHITTRQACHSTLRVSFSLKRYWKHCAVHIERRCMFFSRSV